MILITYFSYHSLFAGPRQLCDYHEGPGIRATDLSSFLTNLSVNKIYLCDSGGMDNQKEV